MPALRRNKLAVALHQRVLRAIQIGALSPGSRLPSSRELAAEYGVDPRVVTAAYRILVADGLIELRPRSGAYVHPSLRLEHSRPRPSTQWIADLFAQGIQRGVSVLDLPKLLSGAFGTRQLRAAVIASTVDQGTGLCRELHDDFGLQARPVLPSTLSARGAVPPALLRAHIIIVTSAQMSRSAPIIARLSKPVIEISLRRDLFDSEWSVLRDEESYVLVADTRFARTVRDYLRSMDADRNVHVLVAGRDDTSRIPDYAPVYATQAARTALGGTRLPKRLLPPARMLAAECIVPLLQAMIQVARKGDRTD